MKDILDKIENIINGTENKVKEYVGTIGLIIIRALLVGFCLYPILGYVPIQHKVILAMFYLAFILLDALRYLAEDQADTNIEYIESLKVFVDSYSGIANSLLNIIEENDIEIEGFSDEWIKEIRRINSDTNEIIKGD